MLSSILLRHKAHLLVVGSSLFPYNTLRDCGTALFDWFHYQHDGPNGGL